MTHKPALRNPTVSTSAAYPARLLRYEVHRPGVGLVLYWVLAEVQSLMLDSSQPIVGPVVVTLRRIGKGWGRGKRIVSRQTLDRLP